MTTYTVKCVYFEAVIPEGRILPLQDFVKTLNKVEKTFFIMFRCKTKIALKKYFTSNFISCLFFLFKNVTFLPTEVMNKLDHL